ncbi:transcriptional regulator [Peribacillus saganii]|uniref:Transcriptional regulator n=1 Tax=Peribacillus saganii TaxID=2303992 RepID=A0A372LRV5_9BACI|nr:helix-turn-helix domain-containing protein [Peribacillus saganii]RFU70522.1 transcriptional regulator [Peribacillus saganii]
MKTDIEMTAQGIQSLELGLSILKKIGKAEKPLSITEISDLCDISNSKLHRYLTSFCRTGFLKRDSSLQYSIGSDLITIGVNASKRYNIKDLAKPALIKLRDTFK